MLNSPIPGQRLKTVHVPKVVKTEDEWRKQLSRGVFAISRQADTELAYSGQYWKLHEKGLYRCICCDNALFVSDTKFDSGTGWPSFWAPVAPVVSATTIESRLQARMLKSTETSVAGPPILRLFRDRNRT